MTSDERDEQFAKLRRQFEVEDIQGTKAAIAKQEDLRKEQERKDFADTARSDFERRVKAAVEGVVFRLQGTGRVLQFEKGRNPSEDEKMNLLYRLIVNGTATEYGMSFTLETAPHLRTEVANHRGTSLLIIENGLPGPNHLEGAIIEFLTEPDVLRQA